MPLPFGVSDERFISLKAIDAREDAQHPTSLSTLHAGNRGKMAHRVRSRNISTLSVSGVKIPDFAGGGNDFDT
jgi:hypothetical protein